MPSTDTRTPTSLYHDWKRRKDADAGQQLAQRVADWYYAIATNYAGEAQGAEVADKACTQFGAGIGRLRDETDLVAWAHSIIHAELNLLGEQVKGLNRPSLYTNARPPMDVLLFVKQTLPEQIHLLESCYSKKLSASEFHRTVTQRGSFPYAIAVARNEVKKLIRDQLNAPLAVVYEETPRDLGPLPLYEASRLKSLKERKVFEEWAMSNSELCQDMAEFAPYAIELRQGIPDRPPPASLTPMLSPARNTPGESEKDDIAPGPIIPDQKPEFLFERPMGRPAPERPQRRIIRVPAQGKITTRMRVTISLITFFLVLAFGLMLMPQ